MAPPLRRSAAAYAVGVAAVLGVFSAANAWSFIPTARSGNAFGAVKASTRSFLDRFTPRSPLTTTEVSHPTVSPISLSASTLTPPPATKNAVEEYVKDRGGNHVIRKVLIANNGMAATKSILSMRQWAYMELGDDRAIEFIVMATPEDLNANAEFIRLADRFVEVPGGSNKNNYANVDLIVDVAVREGVDAVWPGWGHASENPKLPNTLKSKGIKFIGPTGPVMSVLGDKIGANILAQTAKVPSIPWSGDGLTAELTSEGTIPQEVFNKAMVTTVEETLAAAERIGYPVMLKASEGGGGKGIRLSKNAEELKTNFVQVANEVPGSPMFMMQLCTNARHLEVQIVGDEHGNAIALNGRDCSTQRRFQKIFEEGPPTVAPVDVFSEMELAAQRLTQSIGYIGAGTVEYLYNAADNKFYFLELNPRLQVEHPVTEGLTGVNLPATQLQIAMGIPLYAIPDIRRFYGRADAYGKDKIDFFKENYPYPKSHVIAARITAENPDEGFKPTSGRIERVKFQSTSNVWGYFSVGANGGIHEFADSQFGHLFAKGATREDARKALVLALKEIEVRGDIRTTVEYLVQLLETPAFKENTIDTSWLDGLIREKSVKVDLEPHVVAVSAAISRAFAFSQTEEQKFLDNLAKGQVSVQTIRSINSFPVDITFKENKYSFQVTKTAPDRMRLNIGGQVIEAKVRRQPDGSLIADFGGNVHSIYSVEEPLGLRMVLDGTTVLLPTVYDPSELRTDVTGKIVRYLQDDGADVQSGQPYVEVEAMKMIMPLKATESGILTRRMSPGSIITAGDLLATLALKDPSKVKKITPFTGKLDIDTSVEEETTTEQVLKTLKLALEGYEYEVEPLVQRLLTKLTTPEEATAALTDLLTQYLAVEDNYAGKPLDESMVALVKANKDKLSTVLSLAMAHRELPRRNKLISTAIRQLQALQERTGAVSSSSSAETLMQLLDRTSRLPGKEYGEVAISAAQALLTLRTPPFNARLAELRNTLIKSKDSLETLARSTTLTAGVDLLTALFTDKDVRASAIEVYIRRVYRAHTILSIEVEEVDGVIAAHWTFKFSDTPPAESPTRNGYFTVFPTTEAYKKEAKNMVEHFQKKVSGSEVYSEPTNVFHVAIAELPTGVTEAAVISDMEAIMEDTKPLLTQAEVRMVNVLFVQGSRNPRYFTFPAAYGYKEDPLRRDMRPTFPQLLELGRLSANFDLQRLPSMGRNTQVYLGTEKSKAGKKGSSQVLFVRGISNSDIQSQTMGAERLLVMAMDELEYALLDPRVGGSASSRLFLHMLSEFQSDPLKLSQEWSEIMDRLLANYATRLLKLGVDEIEVKVRVQTKGDDGSLVIQPVRLMASSMTGEFLRTDAYVEYPDPITGMTKQFCSISRDEQICLMSPYPASNSIQTRRASARRIGSTYAYDFLGLIEVSLIQKWDKYLKDVTATFPSRMNEKMPEKLFSAEELVLEDGKLHKARRLVGLNDIGMIAWHATMKTPEYPQGRELVIIANDVTFQSGSFGVKEDDFFRAASEYARVRGLPRIYLSSNSGARIGLVDELKSKFKIAWQDVNNPSLGFKYLYLTKDEYNALKPGTVNAELVKEDGEERYAISDIIGQVHGIGVENLRGSGMIAGETSRAYDETFTLSYVTGRSVGIGAYLVRLGQRTIQMVNGPLILTGYSALNKLLGREVYTSQDQLGGPQIMHPNGVSHLVVENDKEGISSILDWLSFVPKDKYSPPPVIDVAVDSPERDVDFQPTKTPYDPRHMLAGTNAPDGRWVSGFFDRGSFIETLGGWGKSVVTGRAKLGGIPFGVIAVETRLVEQRIPADPANPESRESILPQAGQVWYPDSAFKTAQAIEDFNRGENLPLIIFANWRGFSGGTRDMFGEILKFGAKIVDGLRTYKHPVFVYIPANGELRGGAWVVIDPTINEEMMEMYADKDSRGGILEPPGICEVKFRSGDQIQAMHRLDPQILAMDAELENATTEEDAIRLKKLIKEREDNLLPLYLQVAHEFADLHDRAGRMKAKGVIRDVVTWPRSRSYFFWRAKRRIAEDGLVRRFQAVVPGLSVKDARAKIAGMAGSVYEKDTAFLQWVESSGDAISAEVSGARSAAVKASLASLLEGLSDKEKKDILSGL